MTSQNRKINNLILMRYNIAPFAVWHDGDVRNLSPAWLQERADLFDEYCRPSLRWQTYKNFKVITFFDEETPKNIIDHIAQDDFIYPVLTSSSAPKKDAVGVTMKTGVMNYLLDLHKQGLLDVGGIVATTRLDSDDALAPEYFERINQGYREAGEPETLYISFPKGQQYNTHTKTYRSVVNIGNPFGTLFEPYSPTNLKTVFHCNHRHLHELNPSIELDPNRSGWCAIIHGGNVLNRDTGTVTNTYFPVGRHENMCAAPLNADV